MRGQRAPWYGDDKYAVTWTPGFLEWFHLNNGKRKDAAAYNLNYPSLLGVADVDARDCACLSLVVLLDSQDQKATGRVGESRYISRKISPVLVSPTVELRLVVEIKRLRDLASHQACDMAMVEVVKVGSQLRFETPRSECRHGEPSCRSRLPPHALERASPADSGPAWRSSPSRLADRPGGSGRRRRAGESHVSIGVQRSLPALPL